MTDTKIIDAINDLRGDLNNVKITGGAGDFKSIIRCIEPLSGASDDYHYGMFYDYHESADGDLNTDDFEFICSVHHFNQHMDRLSEGLFVPLSDYHKSNISVPETTPYHNAGTQPLHAVSVDVFHVGDTVYDLTGKPTTVQSDVTIGKYTIGKLCGGSAQLYTTCFSSAEHFQRHEEASRLADYISRKLEWGVVPEGVTLADLQTIKSIIDNGVE